MSKRVSLCLIVKNEETNVKACIEPLRALVDEIVVIDTGSTDATKSIARDLGARVFDFAWCDDFAAARNEWSKHATGDFILMLDADDRVSQSEIEKLRVLLERVEDGACYMMTCVCLTIDGGVGCEVEQVRLYPNKPEHRWKHRVHEQITESLFATGVKLEKTDIRVVHTGYLREEMVEKKSERNLRLVEMDCADHPTSPFAHFNRASMLVDIGRHDEAIVALHLCQAFIPQSSPAAPRVRTLLARAHRDSGRLHDALDEARSGRAIFPENRELPYLEAQILVELGDRPSAHAVLFEYVIGHEDVTLHDARMRTLFGELSLRLGSLELARRGAMDVIAKRPSYGPAWLLLADVALACGDRDALFAIADRLSRMKGTEIAERVVRGALDPSLLEGSEPFVALVRERIARGTKTPCLSCLSPPWTTEREARAISPRVFWSAA